MNRRWSAIPLAVITLFVVVGYVLAYLPTPWPFFAVYADLAAVLAPPFEGFRLVVFIVDFLSLLGIFILGRMLASRLRDSSLARFAALGYPAAAALVLSCFWLYPFLKSGATAIRYLGTPEETTIALLMINWYDEHTTRGVVVTTQETAAPLWLEIATLSEKESLQIRVSESQMNELRRLLLRRGYFSLPHRVDVLPSMDHSLFGVSLFVGGRERHVFAKLSSDGWSQFELIWTEVLDYLDLPMNWEWTNAVPGHRDLREVDQID